MKKAFVILSLLFVMNSNAVMINGMGGSVLNGMCETESCFWSLFITFLPTSLIEEGNLDIDPVSEGELLSKEISFISSHPETFNFDRIPKTLEFMKLNGVILDSEDRLVVIDFINSKLD